MEKTRAKFLSKIREGADKITAFLESGATPDEFKQWEADPGFQNEVEEILVTNDYLLDQKIASIGKRKLLDVLENGTRIVKTKTEYTRRYDNDDSTGELVSAKTTREVTEIPTPDWVFRYAASLAERNNVENAIRVLAAEMLLPIEAVKKLLTLQQTFKEQLRQSLTNTQESSGIPANDVALIQAELLGISPERLKDSSV